MSHAVKSQKEVKLTNKQERFCYEYCIDFNATRAAKAAGYKSHAAYASGYENLNKPQIQARIKEMQKNLAKTAGISALKIINEHSKIAFSSIANLKDGWMTYKDFSSLTGEEKSCIQEIQTKKVEKVDDDGNTIIEEWVKVKLYDKQKSLDSLSKILGFDAPIKASLVDEGGNDVVRQIIKWGKNEIKV